MNGKRVFITGGASGLGRSLVEKYAAEGWKVCFGDIHEVRGTETLAALRASGREAWFLRCDVTRESDLQAAADWLERQWGGVDVLVNNAGVAVAGRLGDVPLEDWQWVLDINLLGVVRGCKIFLPIFRRQRQGHIVNIASLAGLVHAPRMAAYNAAKAAVAALSETLHVELAEDGINVSLVCPCFFRTNLLDTARIGDPETREEAARRVTLARRSADYVAKRVYRGVARGDFHILPDLESKVGWRLKRWFPFRLYAKLIAWISAHT
jgi:NAD(P)-dependent dehydrogenase (short-subunit alcohol dehydrogenase family)